MTPSKTDWPVDKPLDAGQVRSMVLENLRLQADKGDDYFSVQHLVHPEQIAIDLEMRPSDRQIFPRVNRDSFPAVANSFVARLLRVGILEPWFAESRSMLQVVVPPARRGALESLDAVAHHEAGVLVELLEDAPLRESASLQISTGAQAHTVVREAVTVVEARLRAESGISSSDASSRQILAALAFKVDGGRLVYSTEPDVQEGMMRMFQGYFAVIANEPHHALPTYASPEVMRILVLSDYLLRVIARSQVRR